MFASIFHHFARSRLQFFFYFSLSYYVLSLRYNILTPLHRLAFKGILLFSSMIRLFSIFDIKRERSLEKLSPALRRKRSPKVPRYKSPDSVSSRSPVRRRSRHRSKSPAVPLKASKRTKVAHRTKYARRSSSSDSRVSSPSPVRRKIAKQKIQSVSDYFFFHYYRTP